MRSRDKSLSRALNKVAKASTRGTERLLRLIKEKEFKSSIIIRGEHIDIFKEVMEYKCLIEIQEGYNKDLRAFASTNVVKDSYIGRVNITYEIIKGLLNGIIRVPIEDISRYALASMMDIMDPYNNGCVGIYANLESIITNDFCGNLVYDAVSIIDKKNCVGTNYKVVFILMYILYKNNIIQDLLTDDFITNIITDEDVEKFIRNLECDTFDQYCDGIKSLGINGDAIIAFIYAYIFREDTFENIKAVYRVDNESLLKSLTESSQLRYIESVAECSLLDKLYESGIDLRCLGGYIKDKRGEVEFSNFILELSNAYSIDVDIKSNIDCLIKQYITVLTILCNHSIDWIYSLRGQIDKLDRQVNNLTSDKERYREFARGVKSTNKKLVSTIDELKSKLNTQMNKNSKQVAYIEKLKSDGITSSEPYIEKINEQSEKLNELVAEVERLRKELCKQVEQNRSLVDTNKKMRIDIENRNKAIESYKSKLESTLSSMATGGIPIEKLVRAIRYKRIAVFGGDSMHSDIKKLGFKNIKLFEASNRNMSFSDLANYDLIVIVTSYMSHATISIPKGASEKYGVPIYYFNNRNVGMLVQELFGIFYSDEYKELKDKRYSVETV